MNAVSNSDSNFTEETASGSDTDTIPDESPDYYQPISIDNEDSDSDQEPNSHRLPNGDVHSLQNGISYLDLSSEEEEEENEEEEEEEERMREAMQRAFREDEMRRRAPLTEENAMRVMEAMRGVSFGGFVPDWAGRVSEDRWRDRLSSIRQSPSSTASS